MKYTVRFDRLPGYQQQSTEEYAIFVSSLIADIEAEAKEARERKGNTCLGRQQIIAMDPHHRPKSIAKSPAPLCHASSRDARIRFKERLASLISWFRESAEKIKAGVMDVIFPPGATPPPFPLKVNETAGDEEDGKGLLFQGMAAAST